LEYKWSELQNLCYCELVVLGGVPKVGGMIECGLTDRAFGAGGHFVFSVCQHKGGSSMHTRPSRRRDPRYFTAAIAAILRNRRISSNE
jgi:hypothetical protein